MTEKRLPKKPREWHVSVYNDGSCFLREQYAIYCGKRQIVETVRVQEIAQATKARKGHK